MDEIHRKESQNLIHTDDEHFNMTSMNESMNILSAEMPFVDSLASSATSIAFDLDNNRPPMDLSAIEQKAATIKEHIDPLELREEGILDVIRNPHDDINSKTLSRLLGERKTVPLRKLKDKIREKVSKSQDLISPPHSVTSISSASSAAPGLCDDEIANETPNAVDVKRKKTKKKARRKAPTKTNLSHPNLAM